MALKSDILDLSRQAQRGPLDLWFDRRLNRDIEQRRFLPQDELRRLAERLVDRLAVYRRESNVSEAFLGMSGGVDSALTAALYKEAGWNVTGVIMPIEQNPEETQRGFDACKALGLRTLLVDLSDSYRHFAPKLWQDGHDPDLLKEDAKARIRRGNIRARLRMMTLYNLASAADGLVASTDNLSELGAGFFTLHGDVGDLSPIQALLKSWEVPAISQIMGVPENTYRALPTDGNGCVEGGDEAQLGASYLEWDLMVFAIYDALSAQAEGLSEIKKWAQIEDGSHAASVYDSVVRRMGATWFKRFGPVSLPHGYQDHYAMLETIDRRLFIPPSLRI